MFNFKKLVVLLLCAGLVFQAHFGIAGPQGGKVVGGNANISQSGPNTTINQTSDRAIINWNSFDIGKNESVRHNMPSSNSAGLHRVVGKGGPSQIEGLLQSNGNIYLVNPAGVVIHNGAKIDVNGFVATTRDIANDNFMKGKMVFDKPGLPGAAIINHGNISLRDNGLAALVAPTVRNDGIIAGRLGKVALGGGDAAWKLDMTGDDLIAFTMDEKTVNTLHAADGTPLASVRNNGKIKAEGGVVVLSAAQLDGIVGSVVNNGEISAASAETKGGKIIFRGQGNKVDVVNNGQLDVSSNTAEGGIVRMTGQADVTHAGKIDATGKTKGGRVVITGENVTLKSGSRIDASGTNGGGTVLVGGNARGQGPELNAKSTLVQSDAEILASAKLKGNGGQIVVWADEKTQFDGKATARGGENGGDGGFVETSAKLLIIGDPAVVDTGAKNGKTGEWLLDPDDYTIANEGGNITATKIMDALAKANISIISDSFGLGNINVNDAIFWSSDNALHLVARTNINVNAPITATGAQAALYIEPKNGKLNIYSPITLSGENTRLYINNKEYVVIKSIEELQNINNNLSGNYALGTNIDASSTKLWDNGAGFKPIGIEEKKGGLEFTGIFNGLGHIISDLTINRPQDEFVGLFGHTRMASITNVGLENVDIVGLGRVGSIMGQSYCSEIYNSYSTGHVTGHLYVGGFIGRLFGGNMMDPIGTPYITNCFTTCDIKKLYSDSDYLGGFVALVDGWESYVRKSYSAGNVPKTEHSGAFCAKEGVLGHVDNCYYDIDTSGFENSIGYGLHTDEMKNSSNYNNEWDFKNIWSIGTDKNYPALKLFITVQEDADIKPNPDLPKDEPDTPKFPEDYVEQKPSNTENVIIYNTLYGDPLIIYKDIDKLEFRNSIENNNFQENLRDFREEIKNYENQYFHSDAYNSLPFNEKLYLQALRSYENKKFSIAENIGYTKEINSVLLFKTCASDLVEAGFGYLIDGLIKGTINIFDLVKQLGKTAISKKIRDIIIKIYITNTLFDFSDMYMNMIERILNNDNLSKDEKTKRIAICLRNSTFYFIAGLKILEDDRNKMMETADKGFIRNFFDAEKKLIKSAFKKIINPFKSELIEEIDLVFSTDLPKVYNFVQDINDIRTDITTLIDPIDKISEQFQTITNNVNDIKEFISSVNSEMPVDTANQFLKLVEMYQQKK